MFVFYFAVAYLIQKTSGFLFCLKEKHYYVKAHSKVCITILEEPVKRSSIVGQTTEICFTSLTRRGEFAKAMFT